MHLCNFLLIGAGGDIVHTDSPRLPLHHPAEVKRPSSENASPQESSGECFIAMLYEEMDHVCTNFREKRKMAVVASDKPMCYMHFHGSICTSSNFMCDHHYSATCRTLYCLKEPSFTLYTVESLLTDTPEWQTLTQVPIELPLLVYIKIPE